MRGDRFVFSIIIYVFLVIASIIDLLKGEKTIGDTLAIGIGGIIVIPIIVEFLYGFFGGK